MVKIALAGDTMLGRLCVDAASTGDAAVAFGERVRDVAAEADLFIANLECCISDRGERWPDPRKPFFFRAPPAAARLLADLGVDVVTLANNHALDYGSRALLDTLDHLAAAGIGVVGAGPDLSAARAPLTLELAGSTVTIVGVADHPQVYGAAVDRPGTAYAELDREVPAWLIALVADAATSSDLVLVTPHWGPNMTTTPVPHVLTAARALAAAGAGIIAGHSAHVFHGVTWEEGTCVLYDMGDFFDDYAVDPRLRNDLGVLWTVHLDGTRPVGVDALPLRLDLCRTVVAAGDDAAWVEQRLRRACDPLRTVVDRVEDTLQCRSS